jgi:hypothetical protein
MSLSCPDCNAITYRSIGGKNICPKCGFDSAYMMAQAIQCKRQFDEYKQSLTKDNSDKSFVNGLWKLYIYYQSKGTKSESQYGVLFHNDQIIEPQAIGDTMETDLGVLKYYNHLEATEPMGEHAGWNFIDRSKIHPSWDSTIEEFAIVPTERTTDGTIKRGWGRAWDVD